MLDDELLKQYNRARETENRGVFCHAPFTSMNFEQNGNVTSCCYNRTYLLGAYPGENLRDIWFGRRADKLRRLMADNRLPAGCEICRFQLQAKNFSGMRARFYDSLADECYTENSPPMPKVLEFEISNLCNLECSMCNGYFSSAIRKNREKLPPLENPYDDSFVAQLKDFIPHLAKARFSGGEPFLIKPYFAIWALFSQLNPEARVSITTNGTILDDRVKETLEGLRAHIILSIDSLEKENFERIRPKADFDRVMENYRTFKEYVERRGTSLSFAVCPMRQNWRELPRLLEFCNDNGVHLFFNTVLWPKEVSLRFLGADELRRIAEYMGDVDLREDTEVRRHNNPIYLDLIRQIASLPELGWVTIHELIAEKRHGEALAVARKIPESDPRRYEATALQGHIRRLDGDLEGAGRDIEKAIEMAPERPDAYVYRAWLRFEQNRLDEGLADALRARELAEEGDRIEPEIYRALGLLQSCRGELRQAVEPLDRLLELEPSSPSARVHRGWAFFLAGRRRKALAEIDAALVLDPSCDEAVKLRYWLTGWRYLLSFSLQFHLMRRIIMALRRALRAGPRLE